MTILHDTEFGKCIEENLPEECIPIGINENIIPTFEEFSKEIDKSIEAGHEAKCLERSFYKYKK